MIHAERRQLFPENEERQIAQDVDRGAGHDDQGFPLPPFGFALLGMHEKYAGEDQQQDGDG
jgi:hypothetical protein